MWKVLTFLRRNPLMTADEFVRYWHDVHAPLMQQQEDFWRHVRKYVQNSTLEPEAHLDGPDAYDGVSELWFDSADERGAEERVREGRHAARAGRPRLQGAVAARVDRAGDDREALLVRVEDTARPVGGRLDARGEVGDRLRLIERDEGLLLLR